jgi:fermentation-respiration switch protein FrsA (DUF1100 family)
VRLVMSNRYNSIKRMQKYQGPVFQSHGANDEVVPIKLARKLFDSSPSDNKQFYEIAYARHNDTPPSAYYEALGAFLDRVDHLHEESLPASILRRNRPLVPNARS